MKRWCMRRSVLALRRSMVGSGTVAMLKKCNVIDAAGEAANHCGIADAVVIARAASRLQPSVAQVCSAAR